MHNLRWTHFGGNNGADLPPKKPGEKLLTMLIAIPIYICVISGTWLLAWHLVRLLIDTMKGFING